jgi:hypothetical protein
MLRPGPVQQRFQKQDSLGTTGQRIEGFGDPLFRSI